MPLLFFAIMQRDDILFLAVMQWYSIEPESSMVSCRIYPQDLLDWVVDLIDSFSEEEIDLLLLANNSNYARKSHAVRYRFLRETRQMKEEVAREMREPPLR